MPLPDILETAEATTALETPQVLVKWTYQDDQYWWEPWVNARLQRSYTRFPTSQTDGTNLLAEAYSATPSTYHADTAATADVYAYYGIWHEHYTHGDSFWTNAAADSFSIKRKFIELLGTGFDIVSDTAGIPAFWFAGTDYTGAPVIARYDADLPINFDKEYGTFDRQLAFASGFFNTHEVLRGISSVFTYLGVPCMVICTNQRIIVIDVGDDTVDLVDNLQEVDLTAIASSGFTIDAFDAYENGGNLYCCALDKTNQEFIYYRTLGPLSGTKDVSGISWIDYVTDLGWENGHFWLSYANHICTTATNPWVGGAWTDINFTGLYLAPYMIRAGSLLVSIDSAANYNVGFCTDDSWMYYVRNMGALSTTNEAFAWGDWYDNCTGSMIGLFHLQDDRGTFGANQIIDQTLTGNGTNVNLHGEEDGRFGYINTKCFLNNTNNTYLDCITGRGPAFNPTAGTIQFQYKANSADVWTNAAISSFFRVVGAAANDRIWGYTGFGNITLYYRSAGGAGAIVAGIGVPSADTDWHHLAFTWDVAGAGITIYWDGAPIVNLPCPAPAFGGPVSEFTTCGVVAACSLPAYGYYGEVAIHDDDVLTTYDYDTFWHEAARVHDFTGRDYTTTPFEFRDQLFDDFLPETTQLKDAEDLTTNVHWFPSTVMSDGEVVHRAGDLADGGQLRALSRLMGLHLDRVVDKRDTVIRNQDIDTCAHRHIDKLSKMLGLDDVRNMLDPFSHNELELPRLRDIVKGITQVWKRKGVISGWEDDTYRMQDQIVYKNNDGVVGASGTGNFTSAGASFLNGGAYRGDQLYITSGICQGKYDILTIPGANQVTVDHTWTTREGSITNVPFEIRRRVRSVGGIHLFYRLFHMALTLDAVYYRRWWDTCVDPRPDVELDRVLMDSYLGPIGVINVRAYYLDYQVDTNINGVTGGAGTSTFDSAGSAWLNFVRPGDLLLVNDGDVLTQTANGIHRILTVPLNTQVTVETVWDNLSAGRNNLTFGIHRYIPATDPMAEWVMSWLEFLTPFNMEIEYADAT